MRRYKHKKHYRIRKKKSIFQRWSFWLTFLILVLLGSGFYFFIFSPIFQIKEIKITGDIEIPVEDLKNTISDKISRKIAFFNLRSIFLANVEKIDETLLEKFPQIAKVKIYREFPNVLAAQIEEREPVAVFCQGGSYFYIDREGVIFEEIPGLPSEVLLIKKSELISEIKLGKEVIDKDKMEQILKVGNNLNNELKIPLKELLVVSDRRFNIKTLEGWEIYFNPSKDLDWQLTELGILLKEKILPEKRRNLQYIDLRFEKIYIYPENYSI